MSDSRQACDDSLPTKQFLHDVHARFFHGRIHIDQLVGDPQLMHHWLECQKDVIFLTNYNNNKNLLFI